MKIGLAVKKIRKEKGWSQEELAHKASITQAALSNIERGQRPGVETMKKISEALAVPESLLYAMALERDEVPKENQRLYDDLFPVIQSMILRLAGGDRGNVIVNK